MRNENFQISKIISKSGCTGRIRPDMGNWYFKSLFCSAAELVVTLVCIGIINNYYYTNRVYSRVLVIFIIVQLVGLITVLVEAFKLYRFAAFII